MKAEASFIVYEEVLIYCRTRAEKAENQGQPSTVRASEPPVRLNSQSK